MKYTSRNIRCVVNGEKVECETFVMISNSSIQNSIIVQANKTTNPRNFNYTESVFKIQVTKNDIPFFDEEFISCHTMSIYTKDNICYEYFVFNNAAHCGKEFEAVRADIEVCNLISDDRKFDSSSYLSLRRIPMWIRRIFKAV